MREWIAAVGAKTAYIEPGSPWENGYCESFNSKLRDELLNGEIFYSLAEGPRRHRNLASSLQHRTPTLVIGLSAAGTRGRAMAGFVIRTGFTGHASLGAKAGHPLRLKLDHLIGAGRILKSMLEERRLPFEAAGALEAIFSRARCACGRTDRWGIRLARLTRPEPGKRGLPTFFYFEDRSEHAGRLQPNYRTTTARGLSWMELGGGSAEEMSDYLGIDAASLGLRLNGGKAGVDAIGIRTDNGEAVIRRPVMPGTTGKL